jgi:hypothetical protein
MLDYLHKDMHRIKEIIISQLRRQHVRTKTKKNKIMATLKDLCSSVPQSLLRVQTDYNLNLQKQAAYNKRMERLGVERAIFEQCKRTRTQKRVKNTFSSEQAGTCGTYVRTVRFENSYITKVCKSRSMY